MLSPPLFRQGYAYKHLTNPASGTSNPMFSIRRKAGMMSTPAVIKSIQSTSSGYQNGLIQIRSVERSLAHNGRTYRRCCRLRPSWNSTNLRHPYLVAQISTGFCMSYLNATNTDNIDFTIEDQIVTYVIVELDQIDTVSMEWREEFEFFEMLCIPPHPPADDPPFRSWWFPPLPSDPDAPHQIPDAPSTPWRSTKYSDNI
jgi:hypothetical protein